jgi:hypothetical protein
MAYANTEGKSHSLLKRVRNLFLSSSRIFKAWLSFLSQKEIGNNNGFGLTNIAFKL